MKPKDRRAFVKNEIMKIRKSRNIIPLVGSGVSLNSGMPTWTGIIDEFAKELKRPYDRSEMLRIPQMYWNRFGEDKYYRTLARLFPAKSEPNAIHNLIFDLANEYILTTNYDRLLEEFNDKWDLDYNTIRSDKDLPKIESRLIIKMHGDLQTLNIVLKEQDYDSYTDLFPRTLSYVKSLLLKNHLILVGFSGMDDNFRRIFDWSHKLLEGALPAYFLQVADSFDEDEFEYFNRRGIIVLHYEDIKTDIERFVSKNPGDKSVSAFRNPGQRLYNMLRYILYCDDDPKRNRINLDGLIDETYNSLYPFRKMAALTPGMTINALLPFRGKLSYSRGNLYVGSDFAKHIAPHFTAKRIKRLTAQRRSRARFVLDMLGRSGIQRVIIDGKPRRNLKIRRKIGRFLSEEIMKDVASFDIRGAMSKVKKMKPRDIDESNVMAAMESAIWLLEIGKPLQSYQLLEKVTSYARVTHNDWLVFASMYNRRRIMYLMSMNLFSYRGVGTDTVFSIRNAMLKAPIEKLWKRDLPIEFRALVTLLEDEVPFREMNDGMNDVLKNSRELYESILRGGVSYYDPPLPTRAWNILADGEQFIQFNFLFADTVSAVRAIRRGYCNVIYSQYRCNQLKAQRPGLRRLFDIDDITAIDYQTLYLTIVYFQPEDLSRAFDEINLETLELDDATRETFIAAFSNFIEFALAVDWSKELFPFDTYLRNFLFLLSRTTLSSVEVESITNKLATFIERRWLQKSWIRNLGQMYERLADQGVTAKSSSIVTMLTHIVGQALHHSSSIWDEPSTKRLIKTLNLTLLRRRKNYKFRVKSKIVELVKTALVRVETDSIVVSNDRFLHVIFPLFPLLLDTTRKTIGKVLGKYFAGEWILSTTDVFVSAVIEGIWISDADTVKRYMEVTMEQIDMLESPESRSDSERHVDALCTNLGVMLERKLIKRDMLKSYRNRLVSVSPLLRYILGADRFDMSEFDIDWLPYLSEQRVAALAGNQNSRDAIVKLFTERITAKPDRAKQLALKLGRFMESIQ